MIHPPTFPAARLNRFTPEQLDNPEQTCVCGRHVPFRSTLAVYTHPRDSGSWDWFSICNQTCFVRHCSEGNA